MSGQKDHQGFTIVELLVVIVIITLVISIIVPTLGNVRTTAKATTSRALMADFMNASGAFSNDRRRAPGYFSAVDMGSDENGTRGMSAMENAMLDLAGADAIVAASGSDTIEVGPIATDTIFVNPALIGVGDNVYFQADEKNLVAQTTDAVLVKQFGVAGHTAGEGELQLPDLVDNFGQPYLLWEEDTTSLERMSHTAPNFAFIDSSSNRGRYYWNANAAFLNSNSLGKFGKDQTPVPGGGAAYSLIGSGVPDNSKIDSLTGFLGSPSFPDEERDHPLASRGRIVIHSAGADGYYLGSKDSGFKKLKSTTLLYERNFIGADGNPYTDEDGNPESIDIVEGFDDIVVTGGN
jgi:prepilin-type N-terminal cleavage/methylation domain-containing protein